MEQIDSQPKNNKPEGNKHAKKRTVVICIIAAVILIAVVVALYFFLYVPHSEAVENFNNSVDKLNAAAAALEERNKELDDNIMSLSSVLNAEDIPVDALMLSEAKLLLEEARNVPKDSAPPIPEMPARTSEINEEASKILELATGVDAMGDYSDINEKLTDAELKYQKMIDDFECGKSEIVWFDVDEEFTVLRFVAKISNSNAYTLSGVETEWTAYDKDDAVVGSHKSLQPDIPANEYTYYVGGAGGALLSGTPARVEVKITSGGLLTNRKSPQILVSNVQLKDNGYNYYTVTADCTTDSAVNTADLSGKIIVRDDDGQIVGANFWSADNLPDTIDADGKFKLSQALFDLPAKPKNAEVYVDYLWG